MEENIKIKSTEPLYFTFFAAYIALAGTTVVTFLGALNDNLDSGPERFLRYSLVSETAVNIIAGITYSYVMSLLDTKGLRLNKVTPIRYLDWFLTTPLLLFSFILFVAYYDGKNSATPSNVSPYYEPLSYIIPLNFLMLIFGYLGETGVISKYKGLVFGFAAYTLLFYFLYDKYVDGKEGKVKTVYWALAFIWFLYGVSYMLKTRNKNISYNFLDIVSKAGFGILIWISTFNIKN